MADLVKKVVCVCVCVCVCARVLDWDGMNMPGVQVPNS